MRIAIIGMGSIGKRHAKNLGELGHKIISIDIGDKFDFEVDCAFICTPTQLHC